ncbi:unnamed protein product [Triticum turgidum subsp. durum]|uniref:Uncharacterized protein n=1 Tax=Triticum turgidum subsp. durum TaxID=4567 RepID=A0A9R0QI21_TRITD|nr:unnamed protein product [Triticum turgidum subsp. durum]
MASSAGSPASPDCEASSLPTACPGRSWDSTRSPRSSCEIRSHRDCLIRVLVQFFQGAITVNDLILRFTGPEMWIMPKNPFSAMSNLRRLLVADVPSSWDASWPRLLIEAAPLLESLYVHVSHSEGEPRQEVPGETSALRHHHLKELVVIGFQRTERQMRLVRFAVEVSTALRRVALLKQGRVEEKGS